MGAPLLALLANGGSLVRAVVHEGLPTDEQGAYRPKNRSPLSILDPSAWLW